MLWLPRDVEGAMTWIQLFLFLIFRMDRHVIPTSTSTRRTKLRNHLTGICRKESFRKSTVPWRIGGPICIKMIAFRAVVGYLDLGTITAGADHLALMTHHIIAIDVYHRTKSTFGTHTCVRVASADLFDQEFVAVFQHPTVFNDQFVEGEGVNCGD